LKHVDSATNNILYYGIEHNIARLKEEIGEYEEAKQTYLKVFKYKEKNNVNTGTPLISMLGLAYTYRKLGIIDSSTFYNKIGIKRALDNDYDIYSLFVLNEGFNLFINKKYQASLDSINKSISIVESHQRAPIINGYVHLGKLHKIFGDTEKSLNALFKIEEYYEKDKYTCIEMREGYEMLIAYYKTAGDHNKQLYYIDKLFAIDSILNTNYKKLNKKIVMAYDTPRLLTEKQRIITLLKQKEKKTTVKFTIAIILVIILIIFFINSFFKNIRYKKRFQELMESDTLNAPVMEKQGDIISNTATSISPDIPKEIINTILNELQSFEKKKQFLYRNITISSLAKKLNTNSKYLSKVINTHKQKSFVSYINELRIEHVIQKLKQEPKFRLYNIKAIAGDVGFNSDAAFSKAFYKKTGIYPSYFIKKLER